MQVELVNGAQGAGLVGGVTSGHLDSRPAAQSPPPTPEGATTAAFSVCLFGFFVLLFILLASQKL